MPSGDSHDRIAMIAALPVAIGAALLFHSSDQGALTGLSFLWASLYCSPDLDQLRSNATWRWGPLRWVWWPYAKLVPHRHWISHSPIGTILRVTYLLGPLLLLRWLLSPAPFPTLLPPFPYQAILLGWILADSLHLLADSLPHQN